MSPIRSIIQRSPAVFGLITCLCGPLNADDKGSRALPEDFAELDAFLDETDLFLEDATDPLTGLDLLEESPFFWSASLRAGAGSSSNFLKRTEEISSAYVKAEADFFLNALFERSSLTTLIYLEGTRFRRDAEVDREATAFLHANWTEIRARYSFGMELDAFFGDQIYDASLLDDGPEVTGASLKQFRPEISLFGEWDANEVDSLKTTLSVRRSLIKDENEDNWRPTVALEWNRVWSGSLGSATELSVYQEIYDDEVAKSPVGIDLPGDEKLVMTGVQLEQVFTWKPIRWDFFSASMRLGAAHEEDDNDAYDGLVRLWASASASLDLKPAHISLRGDWQNTRYKDRQVSSVDSRLVRQRYRTLELELERKLGRNLSLRAAVQWNEFTSRIADDSFSERRVQALLDWTY